MCALRAYIHVQYINIKNPKYYVTLYCCKTLNLDNLNELVQFTLLTFGSRQNFKDFCFSTIIEKFKAPSDFSASLPVCRSTVKEDNDSLKKRMSMHKPHSRSLSDCVCNCVLERICGESEMSEMYYVSRYLQTWTTEPGDQSVHQLML